MDHDPPAPTVYEIRLRGTVPDSAVEELGAVTVTPSPAATVLVGAVADQAELFGLLARLRALCLDVVEVRRVHAPVPGSSA
ncbi:hypothetical protein [Georgenia thermotolerans]|uniref:Uncharacterized protein n=1 Tax=Georgenia thermotolerans TaxID=527326 RepID=A0A7J5UN13_9MICO|nr:hypothetical protein [Georgenia thermotolerans]KAE8763650.1 hypothetical protein GB883_13100 [Georgenia thermotolerans]